MKRVASPHWLVLCLVLVVAVPASADLLSFTVLELVEQSDVVIVGKVLAVEDDSAKVEIAEVLHGELDGESVLVTPIYVQGCTRRSLNFAAGEEVLVFGTIGEAKQLTVVAEGHGKIGLRPKKKEMEVTAAKRLLEIAFLKDEHDKNAAMLALVRSNSERLRFESHRYIVCRISHSKLREQYKDQLIALLDDGDLAIQRTALQAIKSVKADDAVARIVELTQSQDTGIAEAASMALVQYDTPESVSALIALTRHENPLMRRQASVDLRRSRRPEAKEALIRLLDDKDDDVRAMAPRGFYNWLSRNEADDVLPKLVAMLDDPVAKVRASAAETLGECRNSKVVPPLLGLLERQSANSDVEREVLRGLYRHSRKGGAEARALIDKDIHLVVAVLRRGDPTDMHGLAFTAVEILNMSNTAEAKAALQWAAESHPDEETRTYAKRLLSTANE